MQHLTKLHKPNQRRGRVAEKRLCDAYRNVFSGEDGEIVLVDLANYCEWAVTVQMEVGIDKSQVLVDMNARRAVYGRLLHFLKLTPDQLRDLETAAILEQVTDRNEGQV